MKTETIVLSSIAGLATGQMILVDETFDGIALNPSVSPSESSSNAAWSRDLPAGWNSDAGTTPSDGPTEFYGWTAMSKDFWIDTAGNQNRSSFALGSGNVMVADPDEYDDLGNVDPDLFNTILSLTVDLTGIGGLETLQIGFDSSFRPYDTMTGMVKVAFDGGPATELDLFDSATTPGGDSSLARVNESLLYSAEINGATSAVITWEMSNAGNDWWWAIDNVVVTAVPTPAAAGLAGAAGLIALRRRR